MSLYLWQTHKIRVDIYKIKNSFCLTKNIVSVYEFFEKWLSCNFQVFAFWKIHNFQSCVVKITGPKIKGLLLYFFLFFDQITKFLTYSQKSFDNKTKRMNFKRQTYLSKDRWFQNLFFKGSYAGSFTSFLMLLWCFSFFFFNF